MMAADNTDLGNIYMDIEKINVYPDDESTGETEEREETEKESSKSFIS